jgi:GNAT superfamily N-acetyltransferase
MSTFIIDPYVSRPFLQRFEPLVKEKGLAALKLHGDLSTGPPHPFLQIDVTGPLQLRGVCPTCQTSSMTSKVSTVASFRLQALPSCCGVLVSYDSFVAPEWRRRGLGRLMQDMKEFLARQMGVGKLIATVIQGNLAEEKLLTFTGWFPGKPFKNGRSGAVLIEWEKVLK